MTLAAMGFQPGSLSAGEVGTLKNSSLSAPSSALGARGGESMGSYLTQVPQLRKSQPQTASNRVKMFKP